MQIFDRIKNVSWSQALIELILITVGLFMAMQIENWRDNHKEAQLEIKLLHEIKTSLEQDQSFLTDVILPRASEVLNSSQILLNHIYYKDNYQDSIQKLIPKLIYGIEFEPRTSAFENLKSNDINLISSDDLRLKIVALYDFEYQRTLRIIDIIINTYRKEHLLAYLTDHMEYRLKPDEKGEIISILNIPEETLYTAEFTNILSIINNSFSSTYSRLTNLEEEISQLIKDIESELGSSM